MLGRAWLAVIYVQNLLRDFEVMWPSQIVHLGTAIVFWTFLFWMELPEETELCAVTPSVKIILLSVERAPLPLPLFCRDYLGSQVSKVCQDLQEYR